MSSAVRVALVLPELLGTYGDRGNATVLVKRLAWRGIAAEPVTVRVGEAVPADCDIYVLGGGEDLVQLAALERLRGQPGLRAAASRGAVIFAVCAGVQLLGDWFVGPDGVRHDGLGLLDVTSSPMPRRAVGELLVRSVSGMLTGFENHRGGTRLGPSAAPLGTVARGVGNGEGGVDGVIQGRMIGTYLHGPALAGNPELADLLLGWATQASLAPLDLPEVTHLRGALQ